MLCRLFTTKSFVVISLISFCNLPIHCASLDELAIQYGTDKSSRWHNYTAIYERYFSGLKNLPLKFLEIGLYYGASARMWEQYFPNAQLHFIDNSQELIDLYQPTASPRSHCYLVDQANPTDLQQFISQAKGEFDIILDDGGHKMREQIMSFKTLFPMVKSGGMYIIEDIGTSYLPDWQSEDSITTVEFFQKLAHEINVFTAKRWPASPLCADYRKHQNLTYYQQNIESIHFYNSLVFIFKR